MHAAPQRAQFPGSTWRFTHVSPQSVRPIGHIAMHDPPTQICEPGHAVPHAPQFARFDDRSTHAPPQSIWPIWQTVVHSPLWQT